MANRLQELSINLAPGVTTNDPAGAEYLSYTPDGTPVNHIDIGNADTGVAPFLKAAGSDPNIDLVVDGQGTGRLANAAGTRYILATETMRVDFSGATFELPHGAAPTLDEDGEIALDTTVTNFAGGILKYYSGAVYGVVAMPEANFTNNNGYVIAYNATSDQFEMVAQSGGVADGATLVTGLTFPNTGLHILDTGGDHDLIIAYGENAATDRTLTIDLNDADVYLTLGGDFNTAGTFTTSGAFGLTLTLTALTNVTLPASGTLLANVIEDTTPQLGGSLDVNSQKIVSVSNGNIDLEPHGTGNVLIGNFTFDADQTVGAGQDNYILKYNHGAGTISLEAETGGIADGATLATGLTFPNTGLHILDTGGDHDLIIAYGENASADRTLTYVLGNADRSITLGGNITTAGAITFSGAYTFTGTLTGNTGVTFPTTGTLATTSQLHTQNTDTGTTSTTFGLDTGGTQVRIKASSGELQVRNAGDSAYADLRVGNLIVTGTTTTIDSATLTVADNIIVLNSDETGTPSADAGVEVERGTSANAQVLWDESNDWWSLNDGTTTKKVARVHTEAIGDGVSTTFAINHGLATNYPNAKVYYEGGSMDEVDALISRTDANNIDVIFTNAPSASQFRVVVMG